MSGATSSRSCAIWSRSASRWSRRRKRRDSRGQGGTGGGRAGARRAGRPASSAATRETPSAASCARANSTTRRSRSSCRKAAAGCRCSNFPACPGQRSACINHRRHVRQGSAAHQDRRRMTVVEAREPLIAAEADKLLDQDAVVRDAIDEVESNGIVFLDEIDKICARDEARRRRCLARRRAARSPAADRRHDRRHQARPGEDRSYPVHRFRRLSYRQALGSPARTAGPPADPRRAEIADRGRFPAHPHRAPRRA